ncbi:MAG TPA: CDP-alcohol phosphatidyltransferase family protein [Desulfonatronum sp.]|nr:CDP-alcohol phosphatidyltransferase family protein [Desulfonatronum sp.]
MLSEKLGHILDKPLAPLARALPVHPNLVTILGMLIASSSAVILPKSLFLGGLAILAGGACDLLDGIIARVNGKKTDFGAFLDSTLDRVADGFIFFGLAWRFLLQGEHVALLTTVLALIASLVISYARARAEAVGSSCRVGIMERPERILLIALGCITTYIWPAVLIVAALSWATVVQRILHVRKQLA